jgi:predicted NBD/HSP70 family sugar kinase
MDSKSNSRRDFRILQATYFLSTPTRTEIERFTGCNRLFITEALKRLLQKGLMEISGKAQSRGGRPSITYRLGEQVGYSVGISVDAVGFRLVALDARHQVLRELDRVLSLSEDPSTHLDDILRQVSTELRGFLVSAELRGRRTLAIGIAPPGMVDTEKGVWLQGLQFSGITHVALGEMLEKMFGVGVVVEDVTRCLAFMESLRRLPEKARDLVYLYLGSGVGAGIMIGQEPYYGSHGMAGEVGHIVVEEDGARCPCGNIGCLETVVSSSSILQRFHRRLSEGVISSLQKHRTGDGLTLEVIRDAANAGDRLAQSTLFELGTLLGDAVSKIVKLFNPRTLVIGGPVGVLGEHLLEPMRIKVRQKVIPEMLVDLSIEIAPSKPREEATGAAYLAERRFWKNANERSIGDE